MKLDGIKPGVIIKNYKELCGILDIKYTSGNARISQLSDLERYCSYHKEGNKFIIDTVYDEPIPKIIKGNNSIFVEDIEVLLVDLLLKSKKENNAVILTRKYMYEALNLVNINYVYGTYQPLILCDIMNMPKEYVTEFYNNVSVKLRSTVERSFNILKRQKIIDWYTIKMICIKQTVPIYDEGGNLYKVEKLDDINREATNQELEYILKTEKSVLTEMGLKDSQAVFLSNRWREYREKVNEVLQRDSTINYCYDAYKIIFDDGYMEDHYEKLMTLEENRQRINDNMVISVKKSTERKHEKYTTQPKYVDKGFSTKRGRYIQSSEYIPSQDRLTDSLIDEDGKSDVDRSMFYRKKYDKDKIDKLNDIFDEMFEVTDFEELFW